MTRPTDIGKEPPRDQMLVDCWSDHEVIEYVQMVRADYADYWRRRALAAEGLLEESVVFASHDDDCELLRKDWWRNDRKQQCDCNMGEWRARIAAHFAEVKP